MNKRYSVACIIYDESKNNKLRSSRQIILIFIKKAIFKDTMYKTYAFAVEQIKIYKYLVFSIKN